MAVFGAPVAHEDDAERAVRAGLRILEAIDGAERRRPGARPQGADRHQHRRGGRRRSAPGPSTGEGIVTGDVVNTASRLQGVAPGGRRSRSARRRTEATGRDLRLRGARARSTVKGKAEPVPALAGDRGPGAVRRRRRRARTTTPLVGRDARAATCSTATFERTVRDRSVPARHRGRRARRRQEPADRGVLRLRRRPPDLVTLAPGPVPAVRRRHRVLGPRRDREGAGRDPRDRRRRTVAPRSSTEPVPAERTPTRRLAARSGCAARRGRGAAAGRPRGERSPPGGGSWRSSPAAEPARRSSSRTSTGPTTRCSTSSRSSSSGRTGVSLLVLVHGPARAVRAPAGLGARRPRNSQPRRPRAARRRPRPARLIGRAARLRPSCPPRRQAALARARGRQPALRRGVRPDARRTGTAAPRRRQLACRRPTPRSPCRPACRASSPRASTRCSPSGRRCSRTPPSLGKVFWSGGAGGDGRRGPRPDRCRPPRARPQGAGSAPARAPRWRARPSTRSGTPSSATSATGRSRGSQRVAASHDRRRLDRVGGRRCGSRTTPRSSPTTTPRPSSSRSPPVGRRRPTAFAEPHGGT